MSGHGGLVKGQRRNGRGPALGSSEILLAERLWLALDHLLVQGGTWRVQIPVLLPGGGGYSPLGGSVQVRCLERPLAHRDLSPLYTRVTSSSF